MAEDISGAGHIARRNGGISMDLSLIFKEEFNALRYTEQSPPEPPDGALRLWQEAEERNVLQLLSTRINQWLFNSEVGELWQEWKREYEVLSEKIDKLKLAAPMMQRVKQEMGVAFNLFRQGKHESAIQRLKLVQQLLQHAIRDNEPDELEQDLETAPYVT